MRRSRSGWVALGMGLVGLVAWGAAGEGVDSLAPVAVSPGLTAGGIAEVEACPTFSWSRVEGAAGYELVLYRLSEAEAASQEEPRIVGRIGIPGQAFSWTPSRGECLEAGGLYGWAVRAANGDDVGTSWSEVKLFRVPEAPSAGEVEAALGVLRRHLAATRRGDGAPGGGGAEATGRETERAGGPKPRNTAERKEASEDRSVASLPSEGQALVTRAAPVPGTASLAVSDQIHLDTDSHHFKGGELFLWDDTSGNLALGRQALAAATATATANTAVGRRALEDTTSGGVGNTALGYLALADNTTGDENTASGKGALRFNTEGSENTATGSLTLFFNDTGTGNTANGFSALRGNTTATDNTASGSYALRYTQSGGFNTAIGAHALRNNTTGTTNTAIGTRSLYSSTSGSRNIAIGYRAGYDLGSGEATPATTLSDNIYIGNLGLADEEKTIRIGHGDTHTAGTFIQGIADNAVTGTQVSVTAAGQLGAQSSSLRFKEEVEELEAVGERLLELRPVSFRYRPELVSGGGLPEVGLIAEEVAEVFPELVTRDDTGEPFGVRYELLSVLLLEELQEQQGLIRSLKARIERLEESP